MTEKVQEEKLMSEAKVVAETVAAPETVPTPTKKKKNPIVVILLVLFGLAALCCACSVGGFFVAKYVVQKSPQAVAVSELYSALDAGDSVKVKSLSTEVLYNDLYTPYDDGTTIAGVLKGNIEKVTIVGVDVVNDKANVTYTLKTTNNQEIFAKVTYAVLTKSGDKWLVSYIGTPTSTDITATPTPSSYFDY